MIAPKLWPTRIALMHIFTRTMALGLTLQLGALAAHAQTQAPETKPLDLAPALQSDPLDLAPQSVRLDLAPQSTLQPAPIDMLLAASPEVRTVAQWVTGSRDNTGLPYLVVDKINAQVFAFDASGKLQATAPALLGMGRGDKMLVPNDAPMSAIPPDKRITPAGRYVSRLAIDSKGNELLVIDYDASLSLHPIAERSPSERRAERMASATPEDNRISFGCINVPASFYSTVVSPAFTNTKGIVYILPETQTAGELFGFQPAADGVPGAQPSAGALSATSAAAE